MSAIRTGRAARGSRATRRPARDLSASDLARRAEALSMALMSGGAELDPTDSDLARRVVDKAWERTHIAGDHTVVALAGATGSGKSSVFNALVGSPVAAIGARRPTTSVPSAAVWGSSDATELLDWLHVDARHVVSADVADLAADGTSRLDGLVLLDLPDFDSREVSHRVEAERVLELVDVFVWVTDPQKYADARLHDEFVSLLSRHDAATLAVLNQVDRLTPGEASSVCDDLMRLLVADGVAAATVLPTSAIDGGGVAELTEQIAQAVAGHAASRRRLRADIVAAAITLRAGVADDEPEAMELPRPELDSALARAAGVPIVLDAVARDYRREAFAHTGWLFARWTRGFAADPLRRLRLDRSGDANPIPVDIQTSDVRAVLGRSSIPSPSVSAVAAVDVATRSFVRSASDGLPVRWAVAVEDAVDQGEGALRDALDMAVLGTSLRARRPAWWLVVNLMQWTLGLLALAGLAWLAVLWGIGLAQLPRPDTPSLGILPVPLVMLVGGLLLGVGLGALCRWWARVGALRRRATIAKRLASSIATVGDDRVAAPVAEVLGRHRETRRQLDRARS
ncbi:ABC transporter [Humibacillus sp. DSM 29435]|uniref:GTPase n=1 Tax=Humibacillus sp. DSM 29435 TaxID=1869167 RepID=UPI000873287F|nr:GTPase [Humibacillus sp. DSM 29435]OFE16061.1 ABC transporter [Humibacillus sp. DSM 29435]